ncbi:MAG TPA: FtsL-like putative cell division protein [Bacteroidia bacterium]|jgi:hypothetical protein|nr:FtsL-like putative cell division protein [Bacteroidia bacterium]
MMTKNRIIKNKPIDQEEKKEKTTIPSETPEKSAKKGIVIRIIGKIFGGQFLENEEVVKQVPYFGFLVLIGIIYIMNGNIADKKIRDINKLNKEIKELRSNYIITKSELMFLSKQTEVAKRVEPLGLKETTQQPYLILNTDTTLSIY